ncbi:MAG: hypothetical protein PHD54_13120 [Desulfuromonadaceae bacterium]|nr:hypothetical protein [Desulfuromonadaceae bacterium]
MSTIIKQFDADETLVRQTLTLTSLAILKVDIDEHHRNYIDYLVQFVSCSLTSHKPEIVTDTNIAELLKVDFGLNIPVKAVQHVLRIMARNNHLSKEHDVYRISKSLPEVNIDLRRQDAVNRIQRVYDALSKFAPNAHTGTIWTDIDAAKAILGFLGRFTVDCLKSYVFNTALPHIPETGPREHYIVGRFLQYAYENNRPLFEDFIVLVKGQMYANALICPDLESIEKKFNNVTFYLDTPLVLNLFGLQGDGLKQTAEELVSLVRELKGRVAVFTHTLEEIKGVLRFAAKNHDNPQINAKILREIRNSGITISDIIIYIDQLTERLDAFHIRVTQTPEYKITFQIDETTFKNALDNGLHYHGEHAVRNDINSVRAIYVERRGVTPSRLEDAVAVLVTPNPAFAKVAFEFGKTHNSSKEVSSVITDYSLANVAWLKAPMKRPNLPEKETLALCYAALEPSKELFIKYVGMMNQLMKCGNISEHDHAILRLSPIAQRELMDLTLGDEGTLTGNGIKEILGRVKESLIVEQQNIAAEERVHIERQLAEVKESLEAQEIAHQEELAHHLDLGRLANEDRERLRNEQTDVMLIASSRAKFVSKSITLSLMVVLSVSLFAGAFACSGLLTGNSLNSPFLKILVVVVTILATIWGWYSWITGKTVHALTQQLESFMTLRVFAWLTGKPTLPD